MNTFHFVSAAYSEAASEHTKEGVSNGRELRADNSLKKLELLQLQPTVVSSNIRSAPSGLFFYALVEAILCN